jgi:Rod binding domain-containing protein
MDTLMTGTDYLDSAVRALGSGRDPMSTLSGAKMSDAEAETAAKEFEATVISQFVGIMFEGIKTDGPFGGGHAEMMFRSMLTDQYAKSIVEQGGIGLADQVKAELLRLQEGA